MQQPIKIISILVFSMTVHALAHAGPWFTGPILAPAGHTVSRGHTNFEIYGIDASSYGRYNGDGHVIHKSVSKSYIANPTWTHGFSDWWDVQIGIPYNFDSTLGVTYNRLSDVTLVTGLQLVEQNGSPKRADVRLMLLEVLPTGKYDNLNPLFLGTDETGLGSYQTQVGINLQYLKEIVVGHYLRTRLILSHLYAAPLSISGLSAYEGEPNTHGRILGVHENDVDLAFEFTLTQHWVAVMEATYSEGQATRFKGFPGTDEHGLPAHVGIGSFNETALAPALEYNFTENIGLIGGVWFPVSGKNTSYFRNFVLALNTFW